MKKGNQGLTVIYKDNKEVSSFSEKFNNYLKRMYISLILYNLQYYSK